MTRAKKAKHARKRLSRPRPEQRRRLPTGVIVLAAFGLLGVVAVAGLLIANDDEASFSGLPAADAGPIHVHGLGINPADGSLFIATHTGLWRVPEGVRKATRVGDRFQDTMGFTVVGPNHFLGSGHPDINEAREKGLPSLLGLVESTDAGKSWRPISLLGKADFHVLRFAGERVYGYDATNERLLVSADRGRSWKELGMPGGIIDLAVDPGDRARIVAAAASEGEQGLYESRNGGATWKRVSEAVGLLAWPARDRLYVVAGSGQVFASRDGGRRLEYRGAIGGDAAALLAQGADELYVALHDGTIKRSEDGGRTWTIRSAP